MTDTRPALLFDQQDFDLVELIDEFVRQDQNPERLRRLFNTALHPRGIKELAASRQRRIAYAVVRLLDSLDTGLASERLVALRALRDEIIEGGDQALLLNTGRALLETMKHLVRERGNRAHQVELAHDFFTAVGGRPAEVRRKLAEYHLLELDEKWNHVAFDHHVHDAHTKGRKSPTHLIVDAWIKGIREMTVIYYFFLAPEAVAELVEAADVMGVEVQPGVEISARFHDKYAQLIWTPRGPSNAREYLELLASPRTRAFFDEGREVVAYHTRHLLELVDAFNAHHLARLNEEYDLALAPLGKEGFLAYVGVGQPSRSRLAAYVHQKIVEHVETRLAGLREAWKTGDAAARAAIEARLAKVDRLTPEEINDEFLSPAANLDLADFKRPQADAPSLLRLTPAEMITRLKELGSGSITLNPSNLTPADVLEILFECKGAIHYVETFNLKDYQRGSAPFMRDIGKLRRVIDHKNPIACKRMIHEIIRTTEQAEGEPKAKAAQLERLHHILARMPELLSYYSHAPVLARMGSDSTGRARSWGGMGLAVMDTLPARSRREFRRHPGTREIVPVRTEAVLQTTWRPRRSDIGLLNLGLRIVRHVPGLSSLGYRREDSYRAVPESTMVADPGNVLTLGGIPENRGNGLALAPARAPGEARPPSWRLLNSNVKNVAKILIGLVPAFLSFFLTKDWWVLAWCGAFIWFGITGLRNIIQSVIGGAGLIRSDMLRWKDLVRWGRVSDDLLYTGLSVPLLDWLVKDVVLKGGFHITAASAPWLLYAGMGAANGLYIFSHNMFRGLPRQAAFGNLLRPMLAVPLALAINALVFKLIVAAGGDAAHANAVLQAWAAVIQKLSSDTMAGFIEGLADRNVNLALRHKDYQSKLTRLLEVHGQLEAMFPDLDIVESLASPKEFFRTVGKEAGELEKQQIINALDLMYFWMYQPRARAVFARQLAQCAPEERRIILVTQRLLERKRPISEMFIQDLVGKNFSPPLAFYLGRADGYLRDMRALAKQLGVEWQAKPASDAARPPSTGSGPDHQAAAG